MRCEHVDVRDDRRARCAAPRGSNVSMRRTYVPARDTASLPPVWSASALVLMMCRIGFGAELRDRGEQLVADRRRSAYRRPRRPRDRSARSCCRPGPAIMNTLPCAGRTSSSACANTALGAPRKPTAGEGTRADRLRPCRLTALRLRWRAAAPRAYSGYIVCAPPRAALDGNPCRCEYSVEERVRARQVMRHRAARPLDLDGRECTRTGSAAARCREPNPTCARAAPSDRPGSVTTVTSVR